MALWGWLVVYVVLFALLHLLLYYVYASGDDGENANSPSDSPGANSPSLADPNRASPRSSPGPDRYPRAADDADDPHETEADHDLEFDGETVRCPHCGVRNDGDQTFTYCWNCVSMLRQ